MNKFIKIGEATVNSDLIKYYFYNVQTDKFVVHFIDGSFQTFDNAIN